MELPDDSLEPIKSLEPMNCPAPVKTILKKQWDEFLETCRTKRPD
ncbi:hypothetical protein [Endozoicomonas sp. SESOKO4]|nr:hypothetical protein [Endozoicomonas sp. SESOKO4]